MPDLTLTIERLQRRMDVQMTRTDKNGNVTPRDSGGLVSLEISLMQDVLELLRGMMPS